MSDVRANADTVQGFLAGSIGTAIHLAAITPDGPIRARHFGDDPRAAAAWALAENASGANVYWTPNAVRPGVHKKATKGDVVLARFAHVDVDPPKTGGEWDKVAALAEMMAERGAEPSFVIDSGGGLQGFWRLDDGAVRLDDIEAINMGLRDRFGGDACWNIDRVMRLPGTVNYPDARKRARGRLPALATIAEADAGICHDPLALAHRFPARPAREKPAELDQAHRGGAPHLTADDLGLGDYDPLRATIDHPGGLDRSDDALACAGALLRAGFREAQIEGVLLNPANPVSAHCLAQANPVRAAWRCIERVRGDAPAAEVTITATPYVWRDPETLPERPWLFGRWLLRGTVTAVIAPGGIGKTTTLDTIALSVATGKPLLGKEPWNGAGRVWLWNLEDDMDERARSLQAAAKHHELTREDIDGRLFLDSAMDGAGLCTAVKDAAGFRLVAPVFEQIAAELIARGIDLLIVDPFVSSHEVEENANSEIDKIAKAWGRVAKTANASIVLVHHTSKQGSAEVTALSGRGAVSLVNACRSALVLNRMAEDEAEKFGIADDAERRRYFTVQDDKHNRAPPEKADWMRLESVSLGNGGLDGGDSVGVAERWMPPDPFDGLTGDDLYRVQLALTEGEHREDYQSPAWAGVAVARVMGLDPEAKADRARIRKLLKTWIAKGALKVVQHDDAKRMSRKWIEVDQWQNDTSATPRSGEAGQGVAGDATICPTTTPPYNGVGVVGRLRDGGRAAPPRSCAASEGTAPSLHQNGDEQ